MYNVGKPSPDTVIVKGIKGLTVGRNPVYINRMGNFSIETLSKTWKT